LAAQFVEDAAQFRRATVHQKYGLALGGTGQIQASAFGDNAAHSHSASSLGVLVANAQEVAGLEVFPQDDVGAGTAGYRSNQEAGGRMRSLYQGGDGFMS